MSATPIEKQPRLLPHDVEGDEDVYITRMPRSALRYKATRFARATADKTLRLPSKLVQYRRSSLKQQHMHSTVSNAMAPSQPNNHQEASSTSQHTLCQKQTYQKQLLLVIILASMLTTIVLTISLGALLSYWQIFRDDLRYGRPRTAQLDAVVGHQDSPAHPTHFIFINMNRHIQIIEIPGGDISRTRIFSGPVLYGPGQDLTPVTGEIRTENGRRDLILHIMNQQIVYINDGTTFHLQT